MMIEGEGEGWGQGRQGDRGEERNSKGSATIPTNYTFNLSCFRFFRFLSRSLSFRFVPFLAGLEGLYVYALDRSYGLSSEATALLFVMGLCRGWW